MLGKIEGGRRRDDRGWDGWRASPTQWTLVWVSSGSSWWTGKPGVLQSSTVSGSQRVGHDWTTELNWTEPKAMVYQSGVWLKLCGNGLNLGSRWEVRTTQGRTNPEDTDVWDTREVGGDLEVMTTLWKQFLFKMALRDFSHKLLAIFLKTSNPVEMWVTLHHRESRVFAMTWISTCPCSADAHLVLASWTLMSSLWPF